MKMERHKKCHEIKNGYNKNWEKMRDKQEFVKKQNKSKQENEIKRVKAKQEMQNKEKRKRVIL